MAYFPTYVGRDAVAVVPVIRRIEVDAIREALEKGVSDFWAMPSHAAFLALVYPLCGMVLAYAPSYQNALQLLFPLASGFALVGPFVAVGLYEMSRRCQTYFRPAPGLVVSDDEQPVPMFRCLCTT
jgi:uncharacterized membrane protein